MSDSKDRQELMGTISSLLEKNKSLLKDREDLQDKTKHLEATVKLYKQREEQLKDLYDSLYRHKNQQLDRIINLLSSLKEV